ncbi:MAG: hypothetical protein JSR58_06170 [Verrucomicrobia bacterium]|nr:hypothetical protein [Verrucomicrobiota bacterium]
MAVPTTTSTSTKTESVTPSQNFEFEKILELINKDLIGFTQFYLLQLNNLIIDELYPESEFFKTYIAVLVKAFEGKIPENPSARLQESRDKLPNFRFCDVLTLDALTCLSTRKMEIIQDEKNGSFNRYALCINFGVICYFGKVEGVPAGSKDFLKQVEYQIQLRKNDLEKELATKDKDLDQEKVQLTISIRALDKLLEFCAAANKLCVGEVLDEKLWDEFWTTDLGKFTGVIYLIEAFKRDYLRLQENRHDPMNKWAHTVLLGWIEELLLTSFPDLVEELCDILQQEYKLSQTDEKAAVNSDAIRLLLISTSSCHRNYYNSRWKNYLQNLPTADPQLERNISLRLLQDKKYNKKPGCESFLRDVTLDLVKSELPLASICALNDNHPKVTPTLQPLLHEAIDSIYYSRLWGKYIKLLMKAYPKKPTELEFPSIEKELVEAVKTPSFKKAIQESSTALLKDPYIKTFDLATLTNIWREKRAVCKPLQELVDDCYNVLFGFRTYSVAESHNSLSPTRVASNMMVLNFMAGGGGVRPITQRPPLPPVETVESIEQKLHLMTTSGLITWYFKQLEKPQSDLHLQAGVQELGKRKVVYKDVQTDSLSIVSMKTLHEKIQSTNLSCKPVFLDVLYKSIKTKLTSPSPQDIDEFIQSMESSPPNGWGPLVQIAHAGQFLKLCTLYFQNLKKPSQLLPQIESKVQGKFAAFVANEKAIDTLLDPLSASELQALHLAISNRLALSDEPKKYLLKEVERHLLKKIEAMDLPKALKFINGLRTEAEDVADSSGVLFNLAEKHVQKCLQKMSNADLLKAYLQCRLDILEKPTLALTTQIAALEKMLGDKKNLESTVVEILGQKKISSAFSLKGLIAFEKTLDMLFDERHPLNCLKPFVQELIAMNMWNRTYHDLLKDSVHSPSPFVRELAAQRAHSSHPSGNETDAVTLALIGDPERLQELSLTAIQKACKSLEHLKSYSSCRVQSVVDRSKALNLLVANLKLPRIDPMLRELNPLWKTYFKNLRDSWASQTFAMRDIEQKLSQHPEKSMAALLKDTHFVKSLSLAQLERLEKRFPPSVKTPFAPLFTALIHELIAIKVWEMPLKELRAIKSKSLFVTNLAQQRLRALELSNPKLPPSKKDSPAVLALAIVLRQNKQPEANVADLETAVEKRLLSSAQEPDVNEMALLTYLSKLNLPSIQDRLSAYLILKSHSDFRRLLQMSITEFYQHYIDALLYDRTSDIEVCEKVLKQKGKPSPAQIQRAAEAHLSKLEGLEPEEKLSSIVKKLLTA